MFHLYGDLFTLPYHECGVGENQREPKQIKLNGIYVIVSIDFYM
jgi:hypothetical protein